MGSARSAATTTTSRSRWLPQGTGTSSTASNAPSRSWFRSVPIAVASMPGHVERVKQLLTMREDMMKEMAGGKKL